MLRFLGLLVLLSFIVRALAAQLITIDTAGTAALIQNTGGYLFNGSPSEQTPTGVRRIPYNPNTGRINPQYQKPLGGDRYTF